MRRMDDRNLKSMRIDHAIYAMTSGFALTQETPIYHILHVTTCHLLRWSAKSSNCNLWCGAKLIEFFGLHFLQSPRCAQGEMYFVQFDPCKPLPWGALVGSHWWHMFGMSQAATSCHKLPQAVMLLISPAALHIWDHLRDILRCFFN